MPETALSRAHALPASGRAWVVVHLCLLLESVPATVCASDRLPG